MGCNGGCRIGSLGLIFEATQVIVVGHLMGEGFDHPRTLLRRGEHENEFVVHLNTLVAEVGSEHGSDERFADAGGAVEEDEFAARDEVGDEPGLVLDGLGGGEGDELGHGAPWLVYV